MRKYFLGLAVLISTQLCLHAQLFQHLDATETVSILLDDTAKVQQWSDLSGKNHHATNYAGEVYFPSDSYSPTGFPGLEFSKGAQMLQLLSPAVSDSILDFSMPAMSNTGFSVLIAFKVDTLVNEWNDLLGNSSYVASGFGLRYSKTGILQAYLGGEIIQGGVLLEGDMLVFAFNYEAGSGGIEFWNSGDDITRTGNVAPGDFSNENPLSLASLRIPAGGRYFNGMVGEVKVFNAWLSQDDFLSQRNALKLKWTIGDFETDPPLPDPASFYLAPAAVNGSLITMTASSGTDMHGPVEYLFTESSGNPGGSSSGWQRNPNYRDGDLSPLTEYSYAVSLRDAYGNIGKSSDTLKATTLEYSEPGLENDLEHGAYYGYQGWHFAPGDGRVESNSWVHWFNYNKPDAENIHGDMWPDLSEYDPGNLYETQLEYPYGEGVKVYSSHDYSTIDLHVKWMKEYGIKGCVVQRFSNAIDKSNKLEEGDKKILDIMTACEKYGVKFWVMHDAGKGDDNEFTRISNDWKHLVDDLDILQSPAYAYQNGKPAYGLWGMGVNSREWTPETVVRILDFYQEEGSAYQAYVAGGIPTTWYYNRPEGWNPVFDRLDMISPWRTLFYNGAPYKQSEIDRMHAEKAYCDERGIDYNPVVAVGASAGNIGLFEGNLNRTRNSIPRNGGYYLWQQVYEVCKMGSKFMYIAMYDEVDEGTAMYKQVETEDGLPVDCRQLSLDEDGYDLPSDWYLRVGTQIQLMMDGSIPLTEEMPISPERLFSLSPSPEDGADGVEIYPVLKWTSASIAHSYKIYLNKELPIFGEGRLLSTQQDTAFVFSTALESNATYYWKVDVLTSTQTFEGDVWSFTVSESTVIEDIEIQKLTVYPLPARDILHVLGVESGFSYTVYSLMGVKQREGKPIAGNALDVSRLTAGVYILFIDGCAPVRFLKE
ncbi:MAG: hypothetical protein QNK35_15720 [Bacteroides sp.]|nr:hypothetical protein [Bacteroides sp.]